ncbi:MAG TPA: tRNA (guanosine(37)-N1)-methyltransferase TrmD [Rhabdochlamydiaceae bacterium]|nr:tRNA (guanosine(37)-N1)-methyltransferase TrmD [Rhabdochlamydiaceae bacterium]
MIIDILSLFPEYFSSPFDVSMIKRAREKGILDIRHTDIRNFGEGKHRRVDDRPFGGGPGMVLMPKPLCDAIRSVKREDSHVVHLSPQGKLLSAGICERLSKQAHLILVCGHYEGVDQRVIEKEIDEEISIGDYVLTNGCLPAIVLVDALARFIPGVLGHPDAAYCDSFQNDGSFDSPQYTRPVDFEGSSVPEVLRQGDHSLIEKWRRQEAIKKTLQVRPDLIKK